MRGIVTIIPAWRREKGAGHVLQMGMGCSQGVLLAGIDMATRRFRIYCSMVENAGNIERFCR